MSRFSIGITGNTTATANAVRAELRGAPSGQLTRVFEVAVFNAAATAGGLLFGRAGAIGVTPSAPKTLLPLNPSDTAPVVQTAIAWGTPPTLPTDPLRSLEYAAAVGAGMVWTFPEPILIPLGGSLIFWNRAASSSAGLTFYFEIE